MTYEPATRYNILGALLIIKVSFLRLLFQHDSISVSFAIQMNVGLMLTFGSHTLFNTSYNVKRPIVSTFICSPVFGQACRISNIFYHLTDLHIL